MERLGSVDEIVDRYAVENSSLKSKLYIGLGSMFVIFAIAGIWIPGWPTVSWAVPAAFLFSMSSRRLFRWTLTNRFFGSAIFDYYASGKNDPKTCKIWNLNHDFTHDHPLHLRGMGRFDKGEWNAARPFVVEWR